MFDLSDKVAIVTGGYGVLGGSIANGLAHAGASLVILGRNEEAAHRKAKAIQDTGVAALPLATDVLDQRDLESSRTKILDHFGRIDILINAAGGNVARARTDDIPVFNLPFDAFDEVVKLNLHGSVYPTLIFGQAMADQKKGSIVNISSMAVPQSISGVAGYSAGKAAIENFTRWMSVELAQKFGEGMRVNAIAPGFFIAKQNRDVLLQEDGTFTHRAQTIIAKTPMGRFGHPEELQGSVVWLCSDAASFVTGVVIAIDGGFSAFSGL